MQPAIAQERPPYVQFEFRPIEDRDASVAAGRYIAKDVAYALITPQGSRDRIERPVEEWFAYLAEQVLQGRFNTAWLSAFRESFKAWQEGHEPVVDGTDIRSWPVLSPAQVRALTDLRIRTVEDLAAANEETIGRLGMGARALKARATEWLLSAKNVGAHSEQVHALRTELEAVKARNEVLEKRVVELSAAASTAGLPVGPKVTTEAAPLVEIL